MSLPWKITYVANPLRELFAFLSFFFHSIFNHFLRKPSTPFPLRIINLLSIFYMIRSVPMPSQYLRLKFGPITQPRTHTRAHHNTRQLLLFILNFFLFYFNLKKKRKSPIFRLLKYVSGRATTISTACRRRGGHRWDEFCERTARIQSRLRMSVGE